MKTSFEHIRIPHCKPLLSSNKNLADTLGLSRYDIVEGQVIRSVPPKHAVLLIQGQRIMAETKIPLKEGALVSFKVLQVDPQYVLKAVNWTGQPLQGANNCLNLCDLNGFPYKSLLDLLAPFMAADGEPRQGDMPDQLFKIWRLFRDISIVPGREENAGTLKNALQNSGILWEGRLKSAFRLGSDGLSQIHTAMGRDLKGILLSSVLNSQDSETLGMESIRTCLDSLEQLQLLNVSAIEDKGKCLFVIPLRFNGEFRFAQLLVDLHKGFDPGGGNRGKKGAYAIRLLLDMSALGPVHVEASVLEKVLKIDFLVCDEAVQKRFEDAVGYLSEALEKSGFVVKQVKCRCTDKKKTVPASLVDEILDHGKYHISLIV